MSHDPGFGSSVQQPDGRRDAPTTRAVVWRLLPSQRAVARLTTRLLAVGAALLAACLPGLARVAGRGTVSAARTGMLAVGYACLGLALAVPAGYWAAVLVVGVGSLDSRRLLAAWRRLRTVDREAVSAPEESLRL